MAPWEDDFRIPADTYAKHYDLYLHPNMATDRFSGRVTITISTSQPRDSLLCHVKYLNVTKTEVKDDNGVSVAVSNAFEYQPNEFWVVQLGQSITPGNYSLYLEFEGRLDNGIVGFYKSVYQNEVIDIHFQKNLSSKTSWWFDVEWRATSSSHVQVSTNLRSEGFSML